MADLRGELEAVRARFGALTPTAVLEAATPEDHPLHSRFEWNDSVAGHHYRIIQARDLIRSVKVTYTSPTTNEVTSARAYVSVFREEVDEPAYVPSEEVARDPFLRRLTLQAAEREWRALYAKYAHLSEFMEMVATDLKKTG